MTYRRIVALVGASAGFCGTAKAELSEPVPLYTANLPLGRIPVGCAFPRAVWPPHLTVLGNAETEAGLDELLGTVRRVAEGWRSVAATLGDAARFGDDHDVPVRLATSADAHGLHRALRDALAPFRLEWERPLHVGAGYRPHVTTVPGAPVEGVLRLDRLLVARLDGPTALPVASFPLGVPAPGPLSAERAAAMWSRLADAGVRAWIVGGWGVDALAGRTTREHHDLDLLVDAGGRDRLRELVDVRFLWSENRQVAGLPTAFVGVLDGVEVDVHVVRDGAPLWAAGPLPAGALTGRGTIAGIEVACASAAAQRAMHTGYEVPDHQRGDLDLLAALG